MRFIAVFCCALLAGARLAHGFEPKDQVIVTRPVEMKTTTGSTLPLTPGTAVTVRDVNGQQLKVVAGRVGWIDASTVIAATDADEFFSQVVAKTPGDAAALLARAKVRSERVGLDPDKIALALADFDQSIRLAPNSEAYTLRGFAWKRRGEKEKAIADFDAAIRLNPREALAWRVRGATWAAKADYAQALADYSESIRVDPENPDSLHHRAVLQSACVDDRYRNGKQAIADATRACEVSEWQSPLYISGLALANAEAGDFDAAVKWQLKAIELSTMPGVLLTANLELFRQHKPFRMTWR